MRVSLSWLQDLVELNETVEVLSERLSMAGFEVESVENLSDRARGVVVGAVLERQSHPNADKLSVCKVDVGASAPLQIVCGAANVKAGIHVPVAMVGAELPAAGLTIKASELRGVASQGMICSLAELGIVSDSDGIAILDEINSANSAPADLLPGKNVAPLLGLDDTVIELAITANRPDGLSMVGIAREVSALTGGSLSLPELEHQPSHSPFTPEDGSALAMGRGGLYGLTLIESVDGSIPAPAWLRRRLERAGVNSVNAVVDLTNLVMLEQGQPLHAFDLDALEELTGQRVLPENFGLRQARDGEPFTGLDGRELELDQRSQVVTCHDLPVALAGVIGSAKSGVSSTTRRLLLESAMFTPTSVRNTARAVGLRTDASSRFEKGLPREMTLASAHRASALMQDLLGSKSSGIWVCGDTTLKSAPVILRRNAIHQLLGPLAEAKTDSDELPSNEGDFAGQQPCEDEPRDLEDHVIEASLLALGCELSETDQGWSVQVPPSRRMDLFREVDLIEEVARLVGFDRFEANLPDPLEPGGLNARQIAERRLRVLLCGAGLQEITTLSLVGADQGEPERIAISNPLLLETSHLRTNLWEEHLRICQRNLQASQPGCWLFEIGHTYSGRPEEVSQQALLAGAICGERRFELWSSSGKVVAPSYHQARGQLAQALKGLKLEVVDRPLRDDARLHPGRSAQLIVEGRSIGCFGQLHPALAKAKSLPEATYLFELELERLLEAATRSNRWTITYKPFTTVPASERDLAVVVKRDCAAIDLIQVIRKAGKPLLEQVELIDRFEGGQLESDCCSQAFRLRYRSKDSTLTDEQVQPVHEKVRQALVKAFAAELRS